MKEFKLSIRNPENLHKTKKITNPKQIQNENMYTKKVQNLRIIMVKLCSKTKQEQEITAF